MSASWPASSPPGAPPPPADSAGAPLMAQRVRITGARITPVAFDDPPLLNAVGVHEPYALRAIIQLDTDAGLVGLGETYADEGHLRRLNAAVGALAGQDIFALNEMHRAIADVLGGDTGSDGHGLTGMITASSTADRVFSPFEVACLDIQGDIGRPVATCSVAGPPGGADSAPTCSTNGPAIPAGARSIGRGPGRAGHRRAGPMDAVRVRLHGDQIEGRGVTARTGGGPVQALRDAFPGVPLRWTPTPRGTSRRRACVVAQELEGVLEYLEDPTFGLDGHGGRRASRGHAAGHQHVRGGVRGPGPRHRVGGRRRSCSAITTTGEGRGRRGSRRSAMRSGWDCRCIRILIWASAWRR